MEEISILLIGTSASGRWNLVQSFAQRPLLDASDTNGDCSCDSPDSFVVELKRGVMVKCNFQSPFWPGFGEIGSEEKQEQWARLNYDFADCALLVYAINDGFCFHNWLPVHNAWLQKSGPKPVVLVGTKSEMPNRKVTSDEGRSFAEAIGGVPFFEVSAAQQSPQIHEAFVKLINAALTREHVVHNFERRSKCVIL